MLILGYPKTVELKGGQKVVVRPVSHDDFDQLLTFLQSLPEGDRVFLRHDVRDPDVVRKWTEDMDFDQVITLLALDDGAIVGTGRLHLMAHGWMRHVGHVRLITAPSVRRKGLGGLLTRELVNVASDRNLEKLQAHVIEDAVGAVKMFERIGFSKVAVLDGMVKDQSGRTRNLAIMVNNVSNLTQILEDWIEDAMIPAYRVPGGGA